ncbi:PotD/PotF family extracellular solute-binding protein [Haladaptatus sp. CMAA 1911]|uniref:ABC transporter substrate-binding protein n=1 Tax=unclassified Haladaptatus TaxID=2622732 RepID=UPI003753F963
MSNGITRRNFAKYAGAAGGAALAGCLGDDSGSSGSGNQFDMDDTSDKGSRPVKWLSPAWAAREKQPPHIKKATGIEVNITNANNSATQQKILSGANETYDLVSHDTINGPSFTVDNDRTAPVPTSEIDRWNSDNISDIFTNYSERFSHLKGQTKKMGEFLWEDPNKQKKLRQPPHVFNFNGVGFNPKFVDSSVSKYGALFDKQYKGKVAMGAVPAITMNEVMGYLKDNSMINAKVGDLNNPSEDQIDTAIDFLVKQKKSGQFRSTWTAAGTSVNLMASEEAVIGDLWQPAVFAVRRSGTQCNYATMSKGAQGYQYWWGSIIPTNPGSKERNNSAEAADILNFHYGAWFPGYIQNWGYPTPNYPNKSMVRDGSDDTGKGMGPEYYDWAYEGKATYNKVDKPALFDPMNYDWSMKEGSPSKQGQVRDQGDIETRIDRTAIFQIWPDNADYLLEQWKQFKSA